MPPYYIKSVTPLPDTNLRVTFQSGETKRCDMNPLIDAIPALEDLRVIHGLFEQVKAEGAGVSWNDDLDLCAEDLYEQGIPED